MNRRRQRYRATTYLPDVVYEISLNAHWRQQLDAAAIHAAFPIDDRTPALSDTLRTRLRTYQLTYCVQKVPHHETKEWEGYEEAVMFCFRAAPFPDILAYSANALS